MKVTLKLVFGAVVGFILLWWLIQINIWMNYEPREFGEHTPTVERPERDSPEPPMSDEEFFAPN